MSKRWFVVGLVLATGCWDPAWPVIEGVEGEARDGGIPTGSYTWYQDVQPVVQRYCGECHGATPRFAATRSLASYADVMAIDFTTGRPLHSEMAARLSATLGTMPPPSQPQPTQAEIDMIFAWSAGGAAMGTVVDVPYTWHRDIEPTIREACHLCHGDPPQFTAPMSLVTIDDLQALCPSGIPCHEAAAFRIQAPSGRMPPPSHSRQLTSEEVMAITAWSEGGAPEGEPPAVPRDGGFRDGGPPDSGPGVPWANGLPGSIQPANPDVRWVDTWSHRGGNPAMPYEPDFGETIYRCWSFHVDTGTVADVEYVTWMEPILDNLSSLHHLMIFVDDSQLDQREDVVGPFDCDGFPFEADGITYAEYIDGWFPGRGLTPFPNGIGIELRTGYRLILQTHYDRIDETIQDMSGIRLLVDRREQIPTGTLWSGVIWGDQLLGPSERSGECVIQQATTVYRSFPHMHTYGTRIVSDVRRAGSTNWEVIAEIPAWNFEDQPILDVAPEMQQLNVGDTLRTRCFWDTGTMPVRQGDGSFDEMCFNTFFVYPPVPDVGVTGDCVSN
ncbi:MAG: hypothetical protein RMA76_31270 [Deltaproteobacteria bacterium]